MADRISTLVLFGATGDLARRMLLPSLYGLDSDGLLPDDLKIIGTARTALVHCNVTYTQPGATPAPYLHDMALTFTTDHSGTFSGTNCLGENVQGTFSID